MNDSIRRMNELNKMKYNLLNERFIFVIDCLVKNREMTMKHVYTYDRYIKHVDDKTGKINIYLKCPDTGYNYNKYDGYDIMIQMELLNWNEYTCDQKTKFLDHLSNYNNHELEKYP